MSETPTPVSAAEIAPAEIPIPTAPAAPDATAVAASPAESAAPISTPEEGTTDAAGTAYNSARHLPRLHPRTGRWMPRGGRKPGATGARSAIASAASPAANAATPPPAPESYIPAEVPPPPADAGAGKETAAPPPPTPPAPDHSEDAGEVVCSAVEVIAGMVFDAPEECTPPAAEHRNMVRATAAYIRAKGWQSSAGVGVLLMFGAYVLRVLRKPKPQAAARRWFGLDAAERARDVTPPAARPSAANAPAAHTRAEIIELPPGIPPLAR